MKLLLIPAIAFLTLSLSACDRNPDAVVVNGNQPAQVSQGYDNGNYQQQPVYVQQPSTVVVERDHSGEVLSNIATGMLIHHALSNSFGGSYNGSHYSNNNHTNIVNNHYNTMRSNTNNTMSSSRSYSSRPSTSFFSSRKSYTTPTRTSSMRVNSSYTRSSFSSSRARSPMLRH